MDDLPGYLRAQPERWEEATGYLTTAVSVDPDYLNAWKKLSAVRPQMTRPRAGMDRAVLRLLVLDPARHRTMHALRSALDAVHRWARE